MKTITLYLLSVTTCALFLVACNSSGGGGSAKNEPPAIEGIHTSVITETSDPDDAVDMQLGFQLAFTDPNGMADLDQVTVTFPAGQSYDIDLSERLFEGNGTYRVNLNFGLDDVDLVDGNRMIQMNGYHLKVTDLGGLSAEQNVDLEGFEGATVQSDTYLVHPGDYPIASGGGIVEIEGMHVPALDAATISGPTFSIDITIDDQRAYDLTFLFYTSDDEYIGRSLFDGTENLTLSGKETYSFPVSDITFWDGHTADSVGKVMVYSGDKGVHESGDFASISQQLGVSYPIIVTQ